MKKCIQRHVVIASKIKEQMLEENIWDNDDEGNMKFESTKKKFNSAIGENVIFSQDNHPRSVRGVLRGLHYQLDPEPQAKLVRASYGSIFDVAVDIRSESETFGKWVGAELTSSNHHQLWIPEGFAHAFLTLSEVAEVQYKARGFWNKECERAIRWNDPKINIEWPLERLEGKDVALSEKDGEATLLEIAKTRGDIFK